MNCRSCAGVERRLTVNRPEVRVRHVVSRFCALSMVWNGFAENHGLRGYVPSGCFRRSKKLGVLFKLALIVTSPPRLLLFPKNPRSVSFLTIWDATCSVASEPKSRSTLRRPLRLFAYVLRT